MHSGPMPTPSVPAGLFKQYWWFRIAVSQSGGLELLVDRGGGKSVIPMHNWLNITNGGELTGYTGNASAMGGGWEYWVPGNRYVSLIS